MCPSELAGAGTPGRKSNNKDIWGKGWGGRGHRPLGGGLRPPWKSYASEAVGLMRVYAAGRRGQRCIFEYLKLRNGWTALVKF